MTEKDLEEIKQKYGFTLRPSAFNGKPIKYVSRKEYEEKINKVCNQIFEDDSKKEQEKIEKELRKKQNASLRKLKKAVQNKKEVDEFVKKTTKEVETMIEERIDKLIKTYQRYIDGDRQTIRKHKEVLIEKLNKGSCDYVKHNAEKIEQNEMEIALFEMFIESLKYAKTGEIK